MEFKVWNNRYTDSKHHRPVPVEVHICFPLVLNSCIHIIKLWYQCGWKQRRKNFFDLTWFWLFLQNLSFSSFFPFLPSRSLYSSRSPSFSRQLHAVCQRSSKSEEYSLFLYSSVPLLRTLNLPPRRCCAEGYLSNTRVPWSAQHRGNKVGWMNKTLKGETGYKGNVTVTSASTRAAVQ